MAENKKDDFVDNEVRNKWATGEDVGGFSNQSSDIRHMPKYIKPSTHDLQPPDHFRTDSTGKPLPGYNGYLDGDDLWSPPPPPPHYNDGTRQLDDNSYIVKDKGEHFIRDLNDTNHSDPKAESRPVVVPDSDVVPGQFLNGSKDATKVVFSGATTNINPTNDPVKQKIIDYGLSVTEEERVKETGPFRPPLSVMHPFTRIIDLKNPNDHQLANLTTFNRYHLPMADLEHRKAFRHVFFTRPECYVCCIRNGTTTLCQQAEYDEDFNISYSRMPYISKMLAPVYVTGTFGSSDIKLDNFNYLLSNRCMGLQPSGATLSTQDAVGKSIQGYTVTPGMHYEGRQGSSISVTFRDTKYLEIYEYIRLWMLYIWKEKYGVFAPSFNGYQYKNGFPDLRVNKENQKLSINGFSHMHPYDRALDYTASLFDFVMDESDTFPRYWCKYYGIYPIDVQLEALSNSNNDALKEEMSVSVTFKYAYKIENTMKSLIEFNYNAGICNYLGAPNEKGNMLLKNSNAFSYIQKPEANLIKEYIGPGAGFVGTPYVVLMNTNKDIMKDMPNGTTMTPCLRFSPLSYSEGLDQRINMGLQTDVDNTHILAQSDLSASNAYTEEIKAKVKEQEAKEAESDNIASKIIKWEDENLKLDKVNNLTESVMLNTEDYMAEGVKFIWNNTFGKTKSGKVVEEHVDLVAQGAKKINYWDVENYQNPYLNFTESMGNTVNTLIPDKSK